MKCITNPKRYLIIYLMSGAVLLHFFLGHEIIQSLLRSFVYKCVPEMKTKAVKNRLCYVNYVDSRPHINSRSDLKLIYFVTPTYPRPEQVPELTRLAHTLMHVPRIHWIVADDQPLCSDQVLTVLRRSKLPYTHISSPKPFTFKCNYQPKGVANRRAAIEWLIQTKKEAVVYFGDDDNVMDLRLFDEIRNTKVVSMFPVGLIGSYGASSPVVKNGKVFAYFDSWPARRKFPVDMAGFAVNIKLLNWSTIMPYQAGNEENKFLINLGVKIEDIEPLADNCSKVLVWHTRTSNYRKPTLQLNVDELDHAFVQKYQNVVALLKEVYKLGMAVQNPRAESTLTIRNGQYGALVGLKTK